jgi:MFS family permease
MTPIKVTAHRTFHSLLHARSFRRFYVGQAISLTGTWVHQIASAWLVLQLTHSGVALGIQTALSFTPILLFGAWGGTVADRLDRRKILLATQSSFAVLALVLGVLTVTGAVVLWMVYAISLVQGIVTAIDNPTRQSFYADMVRPKDLPNAVSLNSAVVTGTRIFGPALAGICIATVGIGPCFLLNGLSYLAVIWSLHLIRAEVAVHATDERTGGSVMDGLRYVRRTPGLLRPLVLMAVLFLFSFNFSVLLPLLAVDAFGGGAATFGTMMSLIGVGSLAGALLLAHKPRPGMRFLGASAVAFGLFSIALAWTPGMGVASLALIPLGVASIAFMVTGNSTLQTRADPAMRGRVMALFSVVFLGSTPFGAPLAGWTAEILGPRVAFSIGGAIAMLAGVVVLRSVAKRGEASDTPVPRSDETAARITAEPPSDSELVA